VAGYKINLQKSLDFCKKEYVETISITIASKKSDI
jgi:hypothetical protein